MRRINGITLIFILGIMSVLFGISMMNKVYEKHQAKNTDNGSTFVRYGETFDDQMAFKAPIEINNIPLTIVNATPEVPTQAHITLCEQRKEYFYHAKDITAAIYARDIFVNYPLPMVLSGLDFRLKPALNHMNPIAKGKELYWLAETMEKSTSIRINDGERLPSTKHFVSIGTNPSEHGEEIVLSLVPSTSDTLKLGKQSKITIQLTFGCDKTMLKNKSIYKIVLDEIAMFAPRDSRINPNKDLATPIKDFFVIKCGE